jgi:hypothetical protein
MDWTAVMINRAFAIFTILAACGPMRAQNAASMWQFAPPDTKAFVGIHWHNIQESEIGRALRQQMAGTGVGAMPFSGILKDIDEALIASPGKQPDDTDDKQAPVLIRVTGRFPIAEFERMMAAQGAHAQLYKQKRVYRQKKNGDMAMTLLDDHTFLLGDAPSLFAALDRLEWPSPPANPLLARAQKLRDDYDIWALFAVAPTKLAGRLMPDLPLMDDVRGLDLGVSLKTGLDIRVGLETDSEDSATHLSDAMRKTLKLAMKNMLQGPNAAKSADLAAAAKKIQVASDKSDVHVTLRLDAAEVERGLAEAARRQQADKAAFAVTIAPHPVPPPKPPKQIIHIEGLDDGPKEIPLAQ